jgi:diacylglycerol O-acyltransferase
MAANYRYDRLSGQDNTFLVSETPTVHMHIGGISIFELGDLATIDGGVDFDSIRRATEGLLHRIPRYRQKLHWTPVTGDPVWEDDPDFDLGYHLRHTSLPKPGDDEQLKRLGARIMAQQLDRERPLWEMWVVEGLSGERFATITKIHHCMIDGASGVDLAMILLGVEPTKQIDEPISYVPRPAPTGADLFRDEMLRRLSLPLRAARGMRAFQRETEDLGADLRVRTRALGEMIGQALAPPSDTPINGPLGPHRRFDWLSLPLDDVKAVRKAADCTVNDVVLNTACGAFRDYLRLRNTDPAPLKFVASAPVSMRREGDSGSMGNKVSAWQVRLPLEVEDPVERLRAIHDLTQGLKDSQSALGVDMMMKVAEWTPPVLLSLGARAAGSATNTIITNVPGPQFPLYMLGAKLVSMFPMAPLLDTMGMAIALFSYNGRLNWGFIADYQLVPDLPVFTRLVERSFVGFAEALGVEVVGAVDGSLG